MQKMTTASLLMASLLPPAPAPAGQFTSSLGQYPNDGYLRPKQLQELNILPFSMSTMWRKVKTGEFPQPVKLSDAITGFRVGEIREWLLDPQNYGGNHG